MTRVPVRAGIAALGVSVTLTAGSVIVPVLLPAPGSRGLRELRTYFDVTADSSLPAWWMTSLLLAAALALATAGFAAHLARARGAWCWLLGAAVLAVLSLDEHALLSERLATLGAAVTAATGFSRPILAAGLAAIVVVAVPLVLLTVRERGLIRWLLLTGAVVLAAGTTAGALAAGSVLVTPAGWLGRSVGVLLLAAAATSALAVTSTGSGRPGVRIRHHGAAPAAGTAGPAAGTAVPTAATGVPAAATGVEAVSEPLLAVEAKS